MLGPGCWIFVDPLATFGDHAHTRRGSFGLLVEDQIPREEDTDRRLILTAAHLLKDVPDGATVSFAPPGPEPASTSGQQCGVVRRRVPLNFLLSIAVDAAVIKPYADIQCGNEMACGPLNGIKDLWRLEEGETITVRKQGARTFETSGELMPVQADHYMDGVQARYSMGWWAYGDSNTPFAAKGDSGSIVVNEDRNAVGMVVAIDRDDERGGDGFVHGIKQVLSALQVTLP